MNDIKILPNNIECEEAVLGACLLEGRAIYEIVDVLKPEMFYKEAHVTIFECLVEMFKNGEQIDLLTVAQNLVKEGKFESIGGAVYLNSLTSHIVSSANIEYHSAIIKENYVKRNIIKFGQELFAKAYKNSEDLETLVNYIDQEIYTITNDCFGKNNIEHISIPVDKALKETYDKQKNTQEGIPCGIPTGIPELDAMLNGGFKIALYIIAARPAMGKTSLMLHFIKIAVKYKYIPVVFSLEMTNTQLSHRLIQSELPDSIPSFKYKNGWLNDYEMSEVANASLIAKTYTIYVDDNSNIPYSYLKSIIYKKKKQGLCDIVFIDYLQLMDIRQDKGQTKDSAIGEITKKLKALSKDLEIPIVALSQLNREVEKRADKRPMLSDLRESGNIEQDADVVGFIYRPAYYDKNAEQGMGEIIIAKHRDGAIGEVKFYHNESITKIYSNPINSFDYNAGF